jgi:2-polyprenyl-3-methyl-5-hydroxy-6-metoxy-1,4-benzoquinol methylase
MSRQACSLCGSSDLTFVVEGTDRSFPEYQQRYAFYRCQRCGLTALQPRPSTPEELATIYPDNYDSYMGEEQKLLVFLRQIAWLPEIAEILAFTRPESPILEIGCATGEFLATLRRYGRQNVVGTDWSLNASQIAQKRHGLQVYTGDLLELELPVEHFDLIVTRHVLEHVADPRRTLEQVNKLLRPGGLAIFTIPNIDSHTASLFGPHWYGWQIPRHFHLFPRRTLGWLFNLTGLHPVRLHYSPAPNVWIGSLRFWLAAKGLTHFTSFWTYRNPLALLLCLPLSVTSALLRSSGVIRIVVQKPI